MRATMEVQADPGRTGTSLKLTLIGAADAGAAR
jgi:hypothetical protein